MSKERDVFIQKKIAGMTLMEKIGQLLTFTRRGTLLTPSGIEQITRLHCGGLCLEPYAVETSTVLGNPRYKNLKPPKIILPSLIIILMEKPSVSALRRKIIPKT